MQSFLVKAFSFVLVHDIVVFLSFGFSNPGSSMNLSLHLVDTPSASNVLRDAWITTQNVPCAKKGSQR